MAGNRSLFISTCVGDDLMRCKFERTLTVTTPRLPKFKPKNPASVHNFAEILGNVFQRTGLVSPPEPGTLITIARVHPVPSTNGSRSAPVIWNEAARFGDACSTKQFRFMQDYEDGTGTKGYDEGLLNRIAALGAR